MLSQQGKILSIVKVHCKKCVEKISAHRVDCQSMNDLATSGKLNLGFKDDDIMITLGRPGDFAKDGPDVLCGIVERAVILLEDSKRPLAKADSFQVEALAENGRDLAEHNVIDAPSVYWNLALLIVENGESNLRQGERVAYGRDNADTPSFLGTAG